MLFMSYSTLLSQSTIIPPCPQCDYNSYSWGNPIESNITAYELGLPSCQSNCPFKIRYYERFETDYRGWSVSITDIYYPDNMSCGGCPFDPNNPLCSPQMIAEAFYKKLWQEKLSEANFRSSLSLVTPCNGNELLPFQYLYTPAKCLGANGSPCGDTNSRCCRTEWVIYTDNSCNLAFSSSYINENDNSPDDIYGNFSTNYNECLP